MNRRTESRRQADRKREDAAPWRAWYRTKRWFQKRARQLKAEPFCAKHLVMGRHVAASIVDHVEPHRGDPLLFWHGAVQSLCKPCHDQVKQMEEGEGFARDIGDDGWPVDPKHPFNRATRKT